MMLLDVSVSKQYIPKNI